MKSFRAREGDFIEAVEGLIFDVKGLVHPPSRVIAFVRYVPDEKGDRRRGASRYRKVYPLKEREELLEAEYPHYLTFDRVFNERVSEVPVDRITRLYRPQENLGRLKGEEKTDVVEEEAMEFTDLLVEASGISQSKIGVSGSIMVGLHLPTSDIDLVVYGKKNCLLVHKALRDILANNRGLIKAYDTKVLKRLYSLRARDTPMSFKQFLRHEFRKTFQGTFRDRDFFVRYVKDWSEANEQYGETLYRPLGRGRIKAEVIDDSEAIFTPCRYLVGDVEPVDGRLPTPLREVASFRGRFCQHLRAGESITAHGKLEWVKTEKDEYNRLLVGGDPQDYIVSM
jgi:predicted nucleotidyltransferase